MAGTYPDLINCIPFLGNTSFGLGITCSEGWYGYTGALPGYNTADYYSPATGTTIVAWINYQAKEPVEGVASVMVRDIARILTPDHVPFVYKASSEPSEPWSMEAQGSRALSPSMVSIGRQQQQRDTDRRSEYPAARHPRFQHRLIRPSRVVAHRDRAPAPITLHHLLRKLRHAPVQPRTLRNPAAAEAFSRDLVLIKQHRPIERHPVPRASGPTADTLPVLLHLRRQHPAFRHRPA